MCLVTMVINTLEIVNEACECLLHGLCTERRSGFCRHGSFISGRTGPAQLGRASVDPTVPIVLYSIRISLSGVMKVKEDNGTLWRRYNMEIWATEIINPFIKKERFAATLSGGGGMSWYNFNAYQSLILLLGFALLNLILFKISGRQRLWNQSHMGGREPSS